MPDLWMDVDTAISEAPVNIMALVDDTDFKSREESVAYNAAGLELIWHFTTTAGATSATVVTPTTGGDYDWNHQDCGLYTIEIPASGGASINNDTEGVGWFTGIATGVLPWRGPTIGFRAAGLNNLLIDSAHSATRGLAGTALPDAAADAAGGLVISDAGGLDIDATDANVSSILTDSNELQGDWTDGGRLDLIIDAIVADTNELQTDDIPGAISALNDPTAAAIADAVWDEAATGHTDAGKAGQQLWTDIDAVLADTNELQTDDYPTALSTIDTVVDAIKAVTDNLPDSGALSTIDTVVDAIKAVTDNLPDSGALSTIDTVVDAIKAVTDNLPDSGALSTIDTVVDAIKAVTDNLPDSGALSTIDTNIDTINTWTTATIAEITDVTDTPATPTIKQAIILLYMALRNASQATATERRIFNDAGTEILDATMSDDGTAFDQGKLTNA